MWSEPGAQRCSIDELFCKIFAQFNRKYLCWSLLFETYNFVRNKSRYRCFPVNVGKFFTKTPPDDCIAWSCYGPKKKQTPKRPLSSIADDLTKSSIFCQNNFLEQIKIFQNVDKFIKKRFKERTLNLFLMDLVEALKSIWNRLLTLEKRLIKKNFHYSFCVERKIKNFENSDSSSRKDHLEPNNTNSKTEIQ